MLRFPVGVGVHAGSWMDVLHTRNAMLKPPGQSTAHTLRGAGLAATELPGSRDREVGGYFWLCLPQQSVLEMKMVLMDGKRREGGSEGPGAGALAAWRCSLKYS